MNIQARLSLDFQEILTSFFLQAVTNYGERGATKREGGGHVKFYPYEKGKGGGSFSHADGGHKQFVGSFYAVA